MAFRPFPRRLAARTIAALTAVLLLASPLALVPSASAVGIFQQMQGTWRGDGSVEWYDGTRESMRCTAKNEVTDNGNRIAQTLTCANPSAGTPWKIQSNLSYAEAAGAISGTWSENNYGLSGHINGSANARSIDAQVSVSAQNVSVRVSVTTNGNRQTVIMNVTTPEGLTQVSVNMSRA